VLWENKWVIAENRHSKVTEEMSKDGKGGVLTKDRAVRARDNNKKSAHSDSLLLFGSYYMHL
jgi:hypothetical protein